MEACFMYIFKPYPQMMVRLLWRYLKWVFLSGATEAARAEERLAEAQFARE